MCQSRQTTATAMTTRAASGLSKYSDERLSRCVLDPRPTYYTQQHTAMLRSLTLRLSAALVFSMRAAPASCAACSWQYIFWYCATWPCTSRWYLMT